MKDLAWKVFLVLLTLALLILAWQFRTVVIIFLIALAVVAATRPLVENFDLGKISGGIALLLVYITILAIVVMIFAVIGDTFSEEFGMLSTQLTMTYEGMYNRWPEGGALQRAVADILPPPDDFFDVFAGEPLIGIVLVDLTTNLVSLITEFVFIIILSIYWTVDRNRFERLWLSLLPVESRTWARTTYREIEKEIGVYIRSMFVRALLSGVFLGLGLTLLGVDYATLLGLFGALFSLIPWLGVILVMIPAVFSALTTSVPLAVAAAAYVFIILILLEVVVVPKIVNRGKYSSLLMILIAIMLFEGAGLLALVLAPPLSAAIQLVGSRLHEVPRPDVPMSSIQQIADLRTRVVRAREMVAEAEEDIPPNVANMLQRLEIIVDEANELLPVDLQKGSKIKMD